MKHDLEISTMKNTQLIWGDNPNKKNSYQTVDCKIKRQLKIFDADVDAERLITSVAKVIKCWV